MIGNVIVHEVEKNRLKKGDRVVGKIDWNRRYEIMRHHLAVHIVNGAARHVLGDHIWQAGSDVKENKARLDITHFESLDWDALREIERLANEIVLENVKVEKNLMNKDEAEKRYGFRLYQGGAVPGSTLRVKNIPGFDVEACGGTHVNTTGECGYIKIVNSKTIQDGVIRLEFVVGKSALKEIQRVDKYLKDSSEVFRVPPDKLSKTCLRFFEEWKKYRKLARKS
jgi:alanyl-tRNA synthetase